MSLIQSDFSPWTLDALTLPPCPCSRLGSLPCYVSLTKLGALLRAFGTGYPDRATALYVSIWRTLYYISPLNFLQLGLPVLNLCCLKRR